MAKIPKNLSDKDMMAGFEEPTTIENIFLASEKATERKKAERRSLERKQHQLEESFITPELAADLGRKLMELKLELYKEGIVDYRLKVSRDGRRIILEPATGKGKKK
jgi:hypothetical protein